MLDFRPGRGVVVFDFRQGGGTVILVSILAGEMVILASRLAEGMILLASMPGPGLGILDFRLGTGRLTGFLPQCLNLLGCEKTACWWSQGRAVIELQDLWGRLGGGATEGVQFMV